MKLTRVQIFIVKNYLERLSTFRHWTNTNANPKDLARAGFNYVDNDCVRCKDCHLLLHMWEKEDVPIHEHKKYSPNCLFIICFYPIFSLEINKYPSDNDVINYLICRSNIVKQYISLGIKPIAQIRSGLLEKLNTTYEAFNSLQEIYTYFNNTIDSVVDIDFRKDICVICYSRRVEEVFQYCSHCICCELCAKYLDKCPMCNSKIDNRIKLYLC